VCTCAATIAFLQPTSLGYLTQQVSIAVSGVEDLLIRALLDKHQFHDPHQEALNLGISSATWPLFGLPWPSGAHLASRLALRPVTQERILEIGCGLALPSLVAHRRGAQVTASDCHPLAHAFLDHNTHLNGLAPIPYRHGLWGVAAAREDGLPVTTQTPDTLVSGPFDLIIGSDILYERDDQGALAQFIHTHAAATCEIWVVDPNRGNRAAFHRQMAGLGFVMHDQVLDMAAQGSKQAYKGHMLTYTRC
jgi:predicted nicotinamide N-methyase